MFYILLQPCYAQRSNTLAHHIYHMRNMQYATKIHNITPMTYYWVCLLGHSKTSLEGTHKPNALSSLSFSSVSTLYALLTLELLCWVCASTQQRGFLNCFMVLAISLTKTIRRPPSSCRIEIIENETLYFSAKVSETGHLPMA